MPNGPKVTFCLLGKLTQRIEGWLLLLYSDALVAHIGYAARIEKAAAAVDNAMDNGVAAEADDRAAYDVAHNILETIGHDGEGSRTVD